MGNSKCIPVYKYMYIIYIYLYNYIYNRYSVFFREKRYISSASVFATVPPMHLWWHWDRFWASDEVLILFFARKVVSQPCTFRGMILMSLTILEMEMGLSSTRSSSMTLPGADAEFAKQLSDIAESRPTAKHTACVEKLKFGKYGLGHQNGSNPFPFFWNHFIF